MISKPTCCFPKSTHCFRIATLCFYWLTKQRVVLGKQSVGLGKQPVGLGKQRVVAIRYDPFSLPYTRLVKATCCFGFWKQRVVLGKKCSRFQKLCSYWLTKQCVVFESNTFWQYVMTLLACHTSEYIFSNALQQSCVVHYALLPYSSTVTMHCHHT